LYQSRTTASDFGKIWNFSTRTSTTVKTSGGVFGTIRFWQYRSCAYDKLALRISMRLQRELGNNTLKVTIVLFAANRN
jgi:hypothetical protein